MIEMMTAVFSFLGGGFAAAALNYLLNRRKSKAEAEAVIVKAAEQIIQLYDKALNDLRQKVQDLEKEIASLKQNIKSKDDEILHLKSQLGK